MEEEQSKVKIWFSNLGSKIKTITMQAKISFVAIFVFVFALILVTVVSITIDPSSLSDPTKLNDWLTRLFITLFVALYGLIFGEKIARDRLMSDPKKEYQKNLGRYKEVQSKAIGYLTQFNDWLSWNREKELREKKIEYLRGQGVTESALIVDNIDLIEDPVELLTHPISINIDGKIKHIRKKTDFQVRAILDVKRGLIKLNSYTSSYYISQYNDGRTTYSMEEGPRLNHMKIRSIWSARITKVLSSSVMAFLLAICTATDLMNVGNVQAWVNLVTRLCTLTMAIASGFSSARKTVRIMSWQLDDKVSILSKFLSDIESGHFIVMSEEKRARKEVEEYEKQKSIDESRSQLSIVMDAESTTGQPDS